MERLEEGLETGAGSGSTEPEETTAVSTEGKGVVLITSISISKVGFLEGAGAGVSSIEMDTSTLEEASVFSVEEGAGAGSETGAACFWKEWDSCMRMRG